MDRWLIKVFLISLVVLTCSSAQANETATGRMAYRAYFGGLAAVDVKAEIALTQMSYWVAATGRSAGFLDYLFPFSAHAVGRGSLNDPKNGDRGFALNSVFRGVPREIRLEFARGNTSLVRINPAIPPEDRDPVPRGLQNAFDPISALIASGFQKDAGAVCSGTLPVFNGKARSDITLLHTGHDILKSNVYSVFSGPTEKCEARYRTLAGGYKKSWFGRDEPPPVIRFWIAPIGPLGFWAPVRVQAEMAHASIVVHLTEVTSDTATRIGLRSQATRRSRDPTESLYKRVNARTAKCTVK